MESGGAGRLLTEEAAVGMSHDSVCAGWGGAGGYWRGCIDQSDRFPCDQMFPCDLNPLRMFVSQLAVIYISISYHVDGDGGTTEAAGVFTSLQTKR